MLMRRIVHSCSNVHVAQAAVVSIGGKFAAEFSAEAARRAVTPGVLAARMVSEFSTFAAEEDRGGLVAAAHGSDQPILSGLRYILSPAVAA